LLIFLLLALRWRRHILCIRQFSDHHTVTYVTLPGYAGCRL